MNYIISAVIGFILGSFPTAYVLLKKSKGIDITKTGSGNVGAMNSFEVTKSKSIGTIVFFIDALKGFFASFLTYSLIQNSFAISIIGLLFAVIGHCYSPWIKFKGGRGLATAAGGAIFISLPVLIIWGILWLIFFYFKKDIHFGNIAATIISFILPFFIAKQMANYSFLKPKSEIEFSFLVGAIMIIILSKHIEPLKELLNKSKV